jgi:hypothetical protein
VWYGIHIGAIKPDIKNQNMSTTIKNKTYSVEVMDTTKHIASKADLISRGWDGETYILTGKRGAKYLAFRSSETLQFSIV